MTNSNTSRNTPAFYAQSAISFGLSICALLGAVLYLDVNPWIRAFLAVDALWMVSSAFTLAKCVRDQQEDASVVNRLDSARLERLLAEYDPFRFGADKGTGPANGAAPTGPTPTGPTGPTGPTTGPHPGAPTPLAYPPAPTR